MHPSLMNSRLLLWSIVSALAGFLFGFDTVVISGAEKTIQSLWGLSGSTHGMAMSIALWGMVVGSLVGGWPTDRWGRKLTLIWIGLLFLAGSLGSAFAPEIYTFMVCRFLGGIAVGVSTIAAPLYISEIAPPGRRGRLAGMFQFNIVFGIVVAYLSNFLLDGLGENAWRWMLGIMAVPSVIYTAACFIIPESPRWLIAHGRAEEGRRVLQLISPETPATEIDRLAEEIAAASRQATASTAGFWGKGMKRPILLAFLIAAFNQLSGINVILYFAPRLLGLAGIGNPLLASVCIGLTNLVFTFVGLYLIDRLGRKTLLTIGSYGYISSLGICAWAFLSFGGFKAVSSSIDLADASARVVNLESGKLKLLPEDAAAAQKAYAEAKASFATVASTFPEAAVPADASPASVLEIAKKTKATASGALGFKSTIVLLCIMLFIAAHAIGQGAVIWVFISEIFPNKFRAQGQSLGSGTHWVFAASLTYLFPVAIAKFEAGWHFAFFCVMMVLQLLWVKTMVPETKGRSLEEIQRDLGVV